MADRIDSGQRALVRTEVRRLLERSPAFRELPREHRSLLARDMTRVALAVASADDPRLASSEVRSALATAREAPKGPRAHPAILLTRSVRAAEPVHSVDFPTFVASLIHGTFEAVVDASIQQMRAYGDLIKAVSESLGDFVQTDDDDDPDDEPP